jgi:hypothetical protein
MKMGVQVVAEFAIYSAQNKTPAEWGFIFMHF